MKSNVNLIKIIVLYCKWTVKYFLKVKEIMSVSRNKLIVISYIDNETRKLRYYIPNDLYVIIFKYYNSKKQAHFEKINNRYRFKIVLIGDGKTGKTSIMLQYMVCIY